MDKRIVGIIIGACGLLVVLGMILVGNNAKNPVTDSQAEKVDLNITSADWALGKSSAPVTLVEYGDFQCPACAAYHQIVKRLTTEMPDQLRLIFRHFPLTNIHNKAWLAAKASEAAGKQGKFWEMYDLIYEKQSEWDKLNPAEFNTFLESSAKNLGLDVNKFKADILSQEVEAAVKSDQDFGDKLNINGTPTFYVNGMIIPLPGSYERLKEIVTVAAKSVPTPTMSDKVHWHIDFGLFVAGKKYNLNDKKYDETHPDIHLHDEYGDLVHIHKSGMTLGIFFESLKLSVKPTVLYVNGQKYNENWEIYVPKDLERIALSTGELNQVTLNQVTDKACIYSETCPERGKPPTENCVGGLSTPCTVHE